MLETTDDMAIHTDGSVAVALDGKFVRVAWAKGSAHPLGAGYCTSVIPRRWLTHRAGAEDWRPVSEGERLLALAALDAL